MVPLKTLPAVVPDPDEHIELFHFVVLLFGECKKLF